jgi:mRNA-degrading endonuclease YafQ of YafQ-DinJ toxin-antitoxin module
MSITITYTGEFKRNLRQLLKKYVRIREDIEPIIHVL